MIIIESRNGLTRLLFALPRKPRCNAMDLAEGLVGFGVRSMCKYRTESRDIWKGYPLGYRIYMVLYTNKYEDRYSKTSSNLKVRAYARKINYCINSET